MTTYPVSHQHNKDNKALSDQAIEWLVLLQSGRATPEDQVVFDAWLAQSAQHVAAFLDAEMLFGDLAQTATAKAWQGRGEDVLAHGSDTKAVSRDIALTRNARQANHRDGDGNPDIADISGREDHVSPKHGHSPIRLGRGRKRSFSNASQRHDAAQDRARRTFMGRRMIASVAAGIVACLLLIAFEAPRLGPVAGLYSDYATAVGERREITLPDGSEVFLNTASALSVNYSPERRTVRLAAGEAVFRVAKNPARPFVVEAGNGTARAVGTVYDVRLRDKGAEVEVLEGVVAVKSGHGPDAINVHAGLKTRYGADGKVEIPVARDPADTAWQRGKLIFNRQPLSRVIAEVQRYRKDRIVLANRNLANLEVTGVFRLDQLDDLLASINDTTPARVITTPITTVIY